MERVGEGIMEGPDDVTVGPDARAAAAARGDDRAPDRGPLIVYASRTHSQLAQVIRELRATRYRPRMAIMGSRQQMCVHKDVRALAGAAQNAACKARTQSRSCAHHNELEHFRRREPNFGRDDPVDIEDLVKLGERGVVGGGCGPCPYFLSLDMYKEADIVFMPYNYVIDPAMRDVLGDRLDGAIVLFDEAHNIESVCSDAAGFDIPASHLAQAINEAQEAFEAACMAEERAGGEGDREAAGLRWNARGRDQDDGYGGGDVGTSLNRGADPGADARKPPRPAAEYKQLRGVLLALEDKVAAQVGNNGEECVKPGEWLFELLASLKITEQTLEMIKSIAQDAASLLAGEAAAVGQRSRARASGYRINELAEALELAFRARREGHVGSFRLRIGADESRGVFSNASATRGTSSTRGGVSGKGFGAGHGAGPTLSFWCFSPSVTMSHLAEKGVKSVILTSGTLSPMSSFASELGLNFRVRLENPHVVAPHQVWGGVVPVGPSGKRLNSTYRFRDTDEYKSELGNVVVNFARIVPDGMLVFFPSYGVMRACVEHWRNTGAPSIWERICASKHAVVEPSGKEEFREAFKEFNDALEATPGGGAGGGRNGAAFFAVCRGKVSEGIDFADKAGRCVVLTGIPYAPKADAKVRIKRSFLDANRAQNNGNGNAGNGKGTGTLSGEEWYSQGAMRAVNQALGRVIRHRHDYGAVVLADERFAHGNVRAQLSVWLRPAVQPFDTFGKAAARLTQFFKLRAGDPGRPRSADPTNAAENTSRDGGRDGGARFEVLGGGGGATGGATGAARPQPAVGGLLGALGGQFRVDVDAAPPAYPRGAGADRSGRTIAGNPRRPAPGGLAAMLQSRGAPPAAAKPEPPACTDATTSEDRVRLFMRRARSELTATAHEDLTASLRSFRAGGGVDVAGLLRCATRCLRADDDSGRNSLYAAFSALVPEKYRHLHDKHLSALRARDANNETNGDGPGGVAAEKDGVSRQRNNGGSSEPGGSKKRGAGTALSRETGGAGGDARAAMRGALGSQQRRRGSGGGAVVPVANPPPRCVCCGNASRKPFEAACRHPACYSCWLELLGRDGSGNALCPSCQKPVLKRQLQKMFFT